MSTLGTLKELWRYPVKSMAGENLTSGYVTYAGLAGDRVYGFVDREKHEKGDNFPWFTIRELPRMLLYKARFVEAPSIDRHYPDATQFTVQVTTPDGATGDLHNAEFVSELRRQFGNDFLLRFSEKGMHDARPLAILGQSTVAGLAAEVGTELNRLRFRANFYVDWNDDAPFYEDGLVGKRLKIGDRCEVFIQKKDPRCKIITVDPTDASVDPKVLQTVAKNHKGCMGVYGVVIREGAVNAGDTISVVE